MRPLSRWGTTYALGVLFGEGDFRARRMRFGRPDPSRPPVRHRVPRSGGPAMVEARLAEACADGHVVDLRGGGHPEAVQEWLTARNHMRGFGGVVGRFTYKFSLTDTVLAENFDGLAYVARTTCSTPMPEIADVAAGRRNRVR
ncbi:erythromycin esterase family protein [Rhizohabitans arisaemae]|uniref:erythromycin esterase family protein n=1 Tax=Rhizohabitans arisaemae TaxID=2720610 RepID=UPI0024B274ED|nr:erythromycin esterase family protein [Rhizohabitans arisaemae]